MSTTQANDVQPVIACNPSAIDSADRENHVALSKEIFSPAVILKVQELPNGYGFQLPLENSLLFKAVQFIANERLCCPFFTFTLVVGQELWLELSGSPDVKALIASDILPIIGTGNFPTLAELQAVYDEATRTKE